jgi:hypothetical protein
MQDWISKWILNCGGGIIAAKLDPHHWTHQR